MKPKTYTEANARNIVQECLLLLKKKRLDLRAGQKFQSAGGQQSNYPADLAASNVADSVI